MTTTCIREHNGVPCLFLNGQPIPPAVAFTGREHVGSFVDPGIDLFTFTVRGTWWIGPDRYNFAEVDKFIDDYVAGIPGCYFLPRIVLYTQGDPWWGQLHPDEMNVLRSIETGEVLDQLVSDPATPRYLGHDSKLAGMNLHSYHSQVWRQDAARAVAALVEHCEAQPYGPRIWGWHPCDGLFHEWFHWNQYAFDGLADYSPAAVHDFRAWLRGTYGTAEALARAWGRSVDFDSAAIPTPGERVEPTHGEFYDPIRDRPTIDYMQCVCDATADNIIAVCEAAKQALPQPKVTSAFYGYQFSDMPRPQLNGHYSLARLLESPAVDIVASPHAYCNRGEGGYHSPQTIFDSVRRAGKLYLDETDCKTVWTPSSVTWKPYISQPRTVDGTVEMMKKEAAFALATGSGYWWTDLSNQGWFEAPEATTCMRRLREIELVLQRCGRRWFGQIAFVTSQRSMMFQAPREGLHNATLLMFRNWYLSRMGAPFEQLDLPDLARPDLPAFKLYIMANIFHASAEERAIIRRAVERDHATVLWVYAPGFIDDHSASLANMEQLTGITFGMSSQVGELDVALSDFSHPITSGLPAGQRYGTGVDREQYLQPPMIEYMPNTAVGPAFFADDPAARVLGVAESTGRPGLVLKDMPGFRSIYSSAPLLPWPLLRNIARWAGVHVYDDCGDMLWANESFLAIYSQSTGRRTIRFPKPATVCDAWDDRPLGTGVRQVELDMTKWHTKLLLLDG